MNVLFYSTKDYEQPYLEAINEGRHQVTFEKEALSVQTAIKAQGFDVISIFTGDDASADVLNELNNHQIKCIAIRAAGYDNVDILTANNLKMKVANVPAYSPYAIAEHAVALILALNRKIVLANNQVHAKNFTTGNLIGFDLHNKTVGIIGFGRIGTVFAKIMNGFGCRILAYDIYKDKSVAAKYGVEYVDMPTLCKEADIISIHTCLTPKTKYIIDKKTIDMMKRGIMLINTSRGACVNTADVIASLQNGQIGFYGADVYENEKGVFFYDFAGKEIKDKMLKQLLAMPNVLITPHQAFATSEALNNIAVTTFDNIDCWAKQQFCANELTERTDIIAVPAY